MGVAELVERDPRHLEACGQPPEGARDVVRWERSTVLPGEDEGLSNERTTPPAPAALRPAGCARS